MAIRVVLAEDSILVREGVRQLLAADCAIDVVAAVGDVDSLREACERERPAVVVTIPSRTRPQLITSLGEQIASIGRLPYAGSLEYASPERLAAPGARQRNSAQRLQAVWQQLAVPGPVRAALAEAAGPVLLVDDQVDTGWTLTVAASLLREAGAPAVLPFSLAIAG